MRYAAVVEPGWCPTAWRSLARHALQAERHPDAIAWSDAEAPALPAGAPLAELETVAPRPTVPGVETPGEALRRQARELIDTIPAIDLPSAIAFLEFLRARGIEQAARKDGEMTTADPEPTP